MSNEDRNRANRRIVLQTGFVALSALVVRGAQAQAKIAQNLVQYQETPKNGQQCDMCVQFVAPGSCKIVDGKINPKGWCAAFAPKPK